MADICDLAQDHYDRTMEAALGNLSKKANTPEVSGTGYCLSCGEPIDRGRVNPRFCNAVCRDDYDSQSIRQKRSRQQ